MLAKDTWYPLMARVTCHSPLLKSPPPIILQCCKLNLHTGWRWRFNSRDSGRRVWRGRRCTSQSWRGACRRIWANYASTSVTPRRLRDLPARRRAAANANTVLRSQPVASTSQSSPQSTHCPVYLMVICDIAIIPCGVVDTVCVTLVFRTSRQPLQDVPTVSCMQNWYFRHHFTRIYPMVL